MTPRIICPHCHRPIDPLTLEDAVGGGAHYLICPECDDLIALQATPASSVSVIDPDDAPAAAWPETPPVNDHLAENHAL